jgi:hypothetical protein
MSSFQFSSYLSDTHLEGYRSRGTSESIVEGLNEELEDEITPRNTPRKGVPDVEEDMPTRKGDYASEDEDDDDDVGDEHHDEELFFDTFQFIEEDESNTKAQLKTTDHLHKVWSNATGVGLEEPFFCSSEPASPIPAKVRSFIILFYGYLSSFILLSSSPFISSIAHYIGGDSSSL